MLGACCKQEGAERPSHLRSRLSAQSHLIIVIIINITATIMIIINNTATIMIITNITATIMIIIKYLSVD